MKTMYQVTEKGQAIVYLVLGLVVFLGFVALAIDGGMAMADRRHSQNVADAAALAGAGETALELKKGGIDYDTWNCANTGTAIWKGEKAAMDRAESAPNNITIDRDLSDHNGVTGDCTNLGMFDKYIDISVAISDTTPSNFLQLLYPDALHNEVDAMTRLYPITPLGFGNAIIGLNPDSCGGTNGVVFSGNGQTLVEGGGVFSSGCLNGNGRPSVTITSTYGFTYGDQWNMGNTDWTPNTATYEAKKIPTDMYTIDPPTCTNWYTEADIKAMAPNLNPGLYCFHDKVNFGGYDLNGTDVTFYTENDIIFNGNSIYTLSAPTSSVTTGALEDVLIYAKNLTSTCTNQVVQLNGNSNSEFSGIIYAPCAEVTLEGTGDTIAYNSQVVGWNVKVSGDAIIELHYDRYKLIIMPANLELAR